VFRRPAILPLELAGGEFFRPSSSCQLEKGTVDALRPLEEPRQIRDSFVFNAPDGFYYLTGTTSRSGGNFWEGTNGVSVWRSRDLKNFEPVGKIFDYRDVPESWQNQVSRNHNCWAPEIVFYDNTFWITYSTAPGCGLLKSASGRIGGPYLDMGRVVMNGIDSGFFLEGETLYLVWQNGRIAPLSRDGRSMTAEPTLLLPENGHEVGYEGAGLIKAGGWYVLYGAAWNGDERIDGTYDMMYSVSKNLMGPYGKRRPLVPHGGHGCLFYDKEGKLRFTIFGNDRSAPFRRGVGIGYVRIEEQGEDLILSV
jgi:beta-xylosidase